MDRYLIDNFINDPDDEFYERLLSSFVEKSENKIVVDDMIFNNFYANDGYSLQFVVDTTKEKGKMKIEDAQIHHTSPDVWDMEIVAKTRADNAYIVTADDGEHMAVMRFVNHNSSIKPYKEGDKVKAQVVGFVLNGKIYKSEKEYKKENIVRIDNNCMLPLRLLINNNPEKLKSRKSISLPDDDCVMAVNFTIKSCHKIPLHILEKDYPAYYAMEVETLYGDMHLFFALGLMDEPVKQFKKGDRFVGNIMLSGDVNFTDNNTTSTK